MKGTFLGTSSPNEAGKTYFLRDETLRVAFVDISRIKYSEYTTSGGPSYSTHGKVILVLVDGREIELSDNRSESTYVIAKAVSNATGKVIVKIHE